MKSKFGRRLTIDEKQSIKQQLIAGTLSHKAIAEMYGVTPWTIAMWAVKWNLRRGRGPLSPVHPQYKAVPRG
jgi:transposase-like protein